MKRVLSTMARVNNFNKTYLLILHALFTQTVFLLLLFFSFFFVNLINVTTTNLLRISPSIYCRTMRNIQSIQVLMRNIKRFIDNMLSLYPLTPSTISHNIRHFDILKFIFIHHLTSTYKKISSHFTSFFFNIKFFSNEKSHFFNKNKKLLLAGSFCSWLLLKFIQRYCTFTLSLSLSIINLTILYTFLMCGENNNISSSRKLSRELWIYHSFYSDSKSNIFYLFIYVVDVYTHK